MDKEKYMRKRKENMFILVGKHASYYSQQLKVSFLLPDFSNQSFSSSLSSDSGFSSFQDRKEHTSIIPTFNNDRNEITNSFYIPYKGINRKRCLQRHERKMQKYEQIDQSQIVSQWLCQMVPKPRKRPYCHTCGCDYRDYFQHIRQQSHQRQSIRHPIHKEIIKLCRKFKRKDKDQCQGGVQMAAKYKNNKDNQEQ